MQGSVDLGGGYIPRYFTRQRWTLLRNKKAVSWLGFEPATESRESDVLTTTPPSHLGGVGALIEVIEGLHG